MAEIKITEGEGPENKIKTRREALGLSLVDLAKKADISEQKLAGIEANPSRAEPKDLANLDLTLRSLEKNAQGGRA